MHFLNSYVACYTVSKDSFTSLLIYFESHLRLHYCLANLFWEILSRIYLLIYFEASCAVLLFTNLFWEILATFLFHWFIWKIILDNTSISSIYFDSPMQDYCLASLFWETQGSIYISPIYLKSHLEQYYCFTVLFWWLMNFLTLSDTACYIRFCFF